MLVCVGAPLALGAASPLGLDDVGLAVGGGFTVGPVTSGGSDSVVPGVGFVAGGTTVGGGSTVDVGKIGGGGGFESYSFIASTTAAAPAPSTSGTPMIQATGDFLRRRGASGKEGCGGGGVYPYAGGPGDAAPYASGGAVLRDGPV